MIFHTLHYYIQVLKGEIQMLPALFCILTSRKKTAFYVGCTNMGNLGDEVVYKATTRILKNISLYKISYLSPTAGSIGRKLFIKRVDYLILGGGTIIKKDAQSGYLKIIKKLHKYYPLSQLIVFGAGVADPILAKNIGFPTNIHDWIKFLNKCSFITVRGEISRKLLESHEWSINKKVFVLHDPAIHFANKLIKHKPMSKKIGLNFCDLRGRMYGQDALSVENFANTLIKKLIKNSWEIFLYPTVSTDIDYMIKIIDKESMNQIKTYNNFKDVQKSLRFFDTIDLFVGQRLHSIIFSSITYTPFHAIEYESKTSDFLLSFGLNGYATRSDELDADNFYKRLCILYSNMEQEQNKLFDLCQKAKNEQQQVSMKFLC